MYHELWNMSIVLLVLGGVLVFAGIVFRLYAVRSDPYEGHAEARVVDIIPVRKVEALSSHPEFHNRLAAVFEFYAGGRPVTVTDPSDRYPCPYRIGDRVRICYNPEDPKEYRLEEKNRWQQAAQLCHALGVILVLGGCALFLIYAALAGQNDLEVNQ